MYRIRTEHVATALSIVGAVLLSAGMPSLMPLSLIVQIIAGILWCKYSLDTKQNPLLIVNIVFIVVEIAGVYRWSTM